MTDLQADLLTLIQAVREETPHAHDCWLTERGIGSSATVRLGGIPEGCDCDWVARFEAELARRWAVSVEIICRDSWAPDSEAYQRIIEAALAAAWRNAP